MALKSIFGILTFPAILILLASTWFILKQRSTKKGIIEMFVGAILMSFNIVCSFVLYHFSIKHQYLFDSEQEFYISLLDILNSIFPIGLALFSVGFARMFNLLAHIRGRQNV